MRSRFMREAIRLAFEKMRQNEGGPFGAVVVRRGRIIARGWNQVPAANDPTAHAEIMAIREACQRRKSFHLEDCELYTSCEPCPMCLAAIYWARIRRVWYAGTRHDAARAGFNDETLYQELARRREDRAISMRPLLRREALGAFAEWAVKADRVEY